MPGFLAETWCFSNQLMFSIKLTGMFLLLHNVSHPLYHCWLFYFFCRSVGSQWDVSCGWDSRSDWRSMVKHQPLQVYERQLCLSCITGIYGCRWKRYQRSHDNTTKVRGSLSPPPFFLFPEVHNISLGRTSFSSKERLIFPGWFVDFSPLL